MSDEQRKYIRDEYAKINTLPDGVNPVVRVNLYVRRLKTLLLIDELHTEATGGNGAAVTPTPAVGIHTSNGTNAMDLQAVQELFQLHTQQMTRMHQNFAQATATALSNIDNRMTEQITTINHNLHR